MKKIFVYLIFMFLSFFSFNIVANAKEVNVYMFYGKTCPHCEEALEYLNSIKDEYDLNIFKYEVWYDDDNKALMREISDYLDINVTGVPFTIIDNTPIIGYKSKVTDDTYKYHIKLSKKDDFVDKVGIKLGVVKLDAKENKKTSNNDKNLNLPFFKKVNTNKINPIFLSFQLSFINVFNIYTLLFSLIFVCLIESIKNKKHKIILSFIFVCLTVIWNFIFILFKFDYLKFYTLVKLILSVSLILIGYFRLNKFLSQPKKRDNKKVNNIKKLINNNVFTLSIVGIIIFALFYVVIKTYQMPDFLDCAHYFLSIKLDVNKIISLFIYVIPAVAFNLIIVFTLFWVRKSLKINYKYINLVSGFILFIVGILLLLKPELLML